MKPEEITGLIRMRRSVYPPAYNQKPIVREVVEEILENANWAPNHKHTEPWRFVVFQGASLSELGNFLAEDYRSQTPEDQFSEMQYKKVMNKPVKAACVIAVCMQRDKAGKVSEWEEKAAVACAVQNMWLTATAYGIGAYWGTPGAIHRAKEFLDLGDGEQCLGFFFMGYTDDPFPEGKRGDIAEKVRWRN